jgi:hypothetical protein
MKENYGGQDQVHTTNGVGMTIKHNLLFLPLLSAFFLIMYCLFLKPHAI